MHVMSKREFTQKIIASGWVILVLNLHYHNTIGFTRPRIELDVLNFLMVCVKPDNSNYKITSLPSLIGFFAFVRFGHETLFGFISVSLRRLVLTLR